MSEAHRHSHDPTSYGTIFAIGIFLNFSFVLIEVWGGWRSDSLALIADAGHNLSDVGGMLLAWVAYAVSKLKPNGRLSECLNAYIWNGLTCMGSCS
jgi:cobalt-zinc-cadmium efflux system protein